MKQVINNLFFILVCFSLNAQSSNEAAVPPKRAHHQLVYDEAGKTVMMTGGSTPLNGGQSFNFFNDLWTYNGKNWKQVGKAGDERSGIALAYDTKRNKIFSYGGFTGDNNTHGELR